MTLTFSPAGSDAIPLHVIEKDALAGWLEAQPEDVANWVRLNGFSAKIGQALLLPGEGGDAAMAVVGYETASARARTRFALAAGAAKLPEGTYALASGPISETECLGWLLNGYRFDRYRSRTPRRVGLVAPEGVDAARVEAIAAGEALVRDLVNTPTSDMSPDDLEAAMRKLAGAHGADVSAVIGDALLEQNFPMIHAVGRASATPPRLIEMNWGSEGPALTLVGKGVCFDTGGLDLKPAKSMLLMKKDMGGAANVLGLAHVIMALNLPVRLRVLIPAVENAVAGNAFRPSDILTSRKGLTVEVNNTDAEGRLVLADALAYAEEAAPDMIVSMATLTGAARIALGSDIAPYFATDDEQALALESASRAVDDPVWRLPLHAPYESKIEPGIADLDNAPSGGFAGAITAALFLNRFVENTRYMHFDIYAWSSFNQPARPKGGVGQGIRALLQALPDLAK